ncbi:MAG: hypothetical protein LBF41_08765, partial [Deltaproteobacteria bacterium]|nr:hypothetical protein [Deltaproteobacteria bacterium]
MKLKAALISFVVVAVAVLSFLVFVREKMKDEGTTSVRLGLEKIFGKGGFSAEKTFFELKTRSFGAKNVILNFNNGNFDPDFHPGPVRVATITVAEPLMPMALEKLSLSPDLAPGEKGTTLASRVILEGVSFEPAIDGTAYEILIDSLELKDLRLRDSPPDNPKGPPGFLKNLGARELVISNLAASPTGAVSKPEASLAKFERVFLKALVLKEPEFSKENADAPGSLKAFFLGLGAEERIVRSPELVSEGAKITASLARGKMTPAKVPGKQSAIDDLVGEKPPDTLLEGLRITIFPVEADSPAASTVSRDRGGTGETGESPENDDSLKAKTEAKTSSDSPAPRASKG